jgi:4'-phosphopantetheinyl transferase EntD
MQDPTYATAGAACLCAATAELFPAGVVVADLHGRGDPSVLLPEEAAHVGRAVHKRIEEFAAGRACARRALAEFGVVGYALEVGSARQPCWPDGFVGSITHTAGYCAAAVAPDITVRGLGIDCENLGDVHAGLWPSICTDAEIDWIRSLPDADRGVAAAIIFSAKEAFYKCQYPTTREPLGFHDVRVEAGAWQEAAAGHTGRAGGEFRLLPTRGIAYARQVQFPMRGRYRVHGQFMTAAVAAP